MNREQAEHILDAYTRIRTNEAEKAAADALREVILDEMTCTRYFPSITTPNITWPNKPVTTYYTGTGEVVKMSELEKGAR